MQPGRREELAAPPLCLHQILIATCLAARRAFRLRARLKHNEEQKENKDRHICIDTRKRPRVSPFVTAI